MELEEGAAGEAQSNSPINVSSQIDDDFDLSERAKSYKATRFSGIQRKLEKKKSSLFRLSTSSSSSSNTTIPAGSESTASPNTTSSNSASFNLSLPSPTTTTNTTIPPTSLSDLPNTHSPLESLTNIHLSKLSRLAHQVRTLNTHLETLQTELRSPDSRAHPHFSVLLRREISETRAARDAKRVYVDFHRGELGRIVEKRRILDGERGVEWKVPAWWWRVEGEEVWEGRFW